MPKILYVDKGPETDVFRMNREDRQRTIEERTTQIHTVLSALKTAGFERQFSSDLSRHTLALVEYNFNLTFSPKDWRFAAMVSHFPYDSENPSSSLKGREFYEAKYRTSANLINAIKQKAPDLRLIAYTGIGVEGINDSHMQMIRQFLKDVGFDDMRFKQTPEEDAAAIVEKLQKLLG